MARLALAFCLLSVSVLVCAVFWKLGPPTPAAFFVNVTNTLLLALVNFMCFRESLKDEKPTEEYFDGSLEDLEWLSKFSESSDLEFKEECLAKISEIKADLKKKFGYA